MGHDDGFGRLSPHPGTTIGTVPDGQAQVESYLKGIS
jgi:hypothetical protein